MRFWFCAGWFQFVTHPLEDDVPHVLRGVSPRQDRQRQGVQVGEGVVEMETDLLSVHLPHTTTFYPQNQVSNAEI